MELQTEPVEVCPRWCPIQSKLPGSGSAVPDTTPAASALYVLLQGVIIRVHRHCVWADSEGRASEQLHV